MSWTTDTLLTCSLCEVSDYGVEKLLFHWELSRDHPPGMTWEHVARCKDKDACRRRVEADGREWPEAKRDGKAS